MEYEPITNPAAVLDELAKQFEDLEREEKTAHHEQCLSVHANPAPGASLNDQRTVYIVDHGIDALFRLKFRELMVGRDGKSVSRPRISDRRTTGISKNRANRVANGEATNGTARRVRAALRRMRNRTIAKPYCRN